MPAVLNIFLVILSAVLTALAFPPAKLFYLAFVSLMPFFWVIYRARSYRSVLGYALLFGLLFYLFLLHHIVVLAEYSSGFLMVLGLLLLAFFQALFIAAAVLLGKFVQRHALAQNFSGVIWTLLAYAFAWVFLDWLRSLGAFGFTLGGLAYAQYLFPEFLQMARYTGPYGLTFVLIFLNIFGGILAARLWPADKIEKRIWLSVSAALLIFLSFGLGLSSLFLTLHDIYLQMNDNRKVVTVFQPGIPQKIKLDEAFRPALKKSYLEDIRDFSLNAKTDLLVLPETILGEFLLHNKEFMFALRDALDFSLIFGIPRQDETEEGRYYNSVVLLNRYGGLTVLHDKKYLVPFGEYLPFKPLLYWLLADTGFFDSEYSAGKLANNQNSDYAAAICFESTFPYQLREQIRGGGKLILILTNDAWFGRTALLDMHLSFAALRAVENNRYVAQSANTGRSAIIDNRGRILQMSGLDAKEFLTAETVLLTEKTVYTYFGELIIYLALVFFFLYFYLLLYARGRSK
ncbi:MAG: apolipoprotein N-acyltransferase [Candidatus Margulisbacteria bacterium]|jgi:apolipoprotein N-acyltransferase|nr:apolipoprotein N-acyltransferase [Candidatus Margulisiibacteriota bacterium]